VKSLILRLVPVADLLLVPFVFAAAFLLKLVRRVGVQRMRLCKAALLKVGVFPVSDHYYEPQFKHEKSASFLQERTLPGIDWNEAGQLSLLSTFSFASELADLPHEASSPGEFFLNNESFVAGDAEFLYQMIRATKPGRIFEIGSGYSTLMATRAVSRNKKEDPDYSCKHVCIEPYEMPWLETLNVEVVRRRVEELGTSYFKELSRNDILFIDSSHIIRPRGDVLFEYLELLPSLAAGVVVHVHDIFSPRDYPSKWLVDEVKFWNEQYLLEAFLTDNRNWKIIGAVNYLFHRHSASLRSVAPFLSVDSEPGSFYLMKISDSKD
jgi:hypothetical protein